MQLKNLCVLVVILFPYLLKGQANLELSRFIDSLKREDQFLRNQLTDIENRETKIMIDIENIRQEIKVVDSLNMHEVKNIFKNFGYPGEDLVGQKSSHNFWLLIQHCDDDPKFQLVVLSAMRDEVKKGNANGRDCGYLTDRVLVNQGKKQEYGTQMRLNVDSTSYEPELLRNPENVDERRLEIGLGPIEYYIQTMNSRYLGTLKKN